MSPPLPRRAVFIRLPLRLSLIFLLLASAGSAHATLRDAVIVRTMLTDVSSTRMVQIELRPSGSRAVAESVYGVAFSLEKCDWLYTAEYGTRLLGATHHDSLAPTALAQRLRATGAAVERVTLIAHPPASIWTPGQVSISNACIAGSVSLLSHMLGLEDLHEAGLVLLSFHAPAGGLDQGMVIDHSVLVYREHDRWMCRDPRSPDQPFSLAAVRVGAPLDPALAELALRSRYPLEKARLLMFGPGTLEQLKSNAVWRVNSGTP